MARYILIKIWLYIWPYSLSVYQDVITIFKRCHGACVHSLGQTTIGEKKIGQFSKMTKTIN